ncbi:MAG: APC family permease, partial [Thermoplasmata archaeon]
MKDPWGFLGGWLSWFGHSIVGSFYIFGFGLGAVVFLESLTGRSDLVLFGLGEDALTRLFAVLAAGIFIGLNYRGTKITGRSETLVTLTLLAIVVTFIVFGLAFIFGPAPFPAQNFQPFFRGNAGWQQFVALLGAMGFTFIVFEGYEIIAQTGEEARNPEKNIPRANFIVIGLSTIIFVLVAITAIGVGGNCPPVGTTPGCLLLKEAPEGVVGNTDAIAEIAARVMPYGSYVIVFGIVLGALAATNSLVFSSSRVAFAMGRDGTLPRALGRLNPKTRTPHVSIVVSGGIMILMTLTLDIRTVAASADIMFLLLFLFVNWSAIVLRRTMPDLKRYYRMPFFPYIPIAGIVSKFVIAVALWAIEPVAWLIAFGWIGLGLSVHYLYERKE